MDTTEDIIDFDPTQYTDDAGDYTFGLADDQGVYQSIDPFEKWVGEGPQDWTQTDWDVYSQLSGLDPYSGRRTVEDEYGEMLESAGISKDLYSQYSQDPRMWELLQSLSGSGGITTLDPFSPQAAQFQEFVRPGGATQRGAAELSYDTGYDPVTGAPFGPWSYDAPPVQPEVGWGDSAEDQAQLDYLQGEYDISAAAGEPFGSDWYNLMQGKSLFDLRDKLRGMGISEDIANGILDRLDQGKLLSGDPFVEAFLEYVPIGRNEEGYIDPADWQAVEDLAAGVVAGETEEDVVEQTDQQSFAELFSDDPSADFWAYGPQYEQWLRDVKYKDNLNLDYLKERQESIDNPGDRRPGEPISWTPGADIAIPDADPWFQTGEHDPVDVAGTGPYATGIQYGDPEPFAVSSPFGQTWGIDTKVYPDIIDISAEDKEIFKQSEQFFTFVRDDAEERDALNPDDTVDMFKYQQSLTASESAEYVQDIMDAYNYYGAEWERISPDYYLAAQKAGSKFMGTAEHGQRVEDLADSLGPYANELVTLLKNAGYDTDLASVLSILSGASAGDFAGTDKTDEGEEGEEEEGTGGILDATAPGTSVINTPAADADNSGEAIDGATNDSTELPPKNGFINPFQPTVPNAFTTLFSPVSDIETSGLKRDNIMDALIGSSNSAAGVQLGNLSGRSGNKVDIPNFVADAASIEGAAVDPVAYWMGLSSANKQILLDMADRDDLDTGMTTYDNPEGDLYRTSNDVTKFYLPAWAVDIVFPTIDSEPGTIDFGEYAGAEPNYAWWQSIGANRRLALQQLMADRGKNTDLIAVREMERKTVDGKDVAFVRKAKSFTDRDGSFSPEWQDDSDIDRDVSIHLQTEPVGFTDFIKWMIEGNSNLDPLAIFYDDPDYKKRKGYDRDDVGIYLRPTDTSRAAIGLESVVPASGDKFYGGHKSEDKHDLVSEFDSDSVTRGTYGAFSRTAWNYFLNHYDDWVGEDNIRSVPLPFDVSEADLVGISTNLGNVRYVTGDSKQTSVATYEYGSGYTGQGYNRQTSSPTYKSINIYTDEMGNSLAVPDFGSVSPINNFGDIGGSSYGTSSFDMNEFFSEFNKTVGPDQLYASSPENLINWDEGEDWYDYGGKWVEDDNTPLYYNDGSSAQAMWGALSLFIPAYEDYLLSHDDAAVDVEAPSFSSFLDSGRAGVRPEYNVLDLGQTAVQTLAFQQNAASQYESFVNSLNIMPSWSGSMVAGDVDYLNMYYGGSYGTTGEVDPSGETGWSPETAGFMFYEHDMSDRIAAPTRGGDGGGNFAGGRVLPYFDGGIVNAGATQAAAPPESLGIGAFSAPSGVSQLESLVQQDPILQEAVDAFMGMHPSPQEAINRAIEKYGEELLMKLARMVQTSGGPTSTYVPGEGGGLADTIPAMIDGNQPAALSSGEFVVPADVVSHLGDGNNENGAGKLDSMMSRVRVDKTGVPEQPGPINEEEVLPA